MTSLVFRFLNNADLTFLPYLLLCQTTYYYECDFVKLLIMKGITSGNEKNA